MSIFWELIRLDLHAFKDWFGRQTIAKIIIFVAYLSVMVGVGLGVYFWSDTFFRYIVEYENYGSLTSLYVMRASFLLLIWLGVLSSMISSITFLLGNDRHLDLLQTYPISSLSLSLRANVKSSLLTLSLLLVSVFPLSLSYSDNLVGSLVAIVLVMVITESVGASLGYVVSLFLRRKYGLVWGLLSGGLLLFITWIVLRTTFPRQLDLLPDVAIEGFAPIFENLPLIKSYWLTGAFVGITNGGYWQNFPVFAFAILSLLGFLYIQAKLLIPCRQAQKMHAATLLKPQSSLGRFRHLNLITKDILSVVRNPRDLGYLIFLLSMVVAFFGLFGRGY